jgi:hypothetical protein
VNRIFSPYGEGWPGFPRKAFARLDQTEPVDPRNSDEAVFAFDAVDAEWSGFRGGGFFDLQRPDDTQARLNQLWRGMFGSADNRPSATSFDDIPIYRIEVTSRPDDPFWSTLIGFSEQDWITLDLADVGVFPVDVYGGILAAAAEAFLQSVTKTSDLQSTALSAVFDVDLWPNANVADIDRLVRSIGPLDSLVAYDVGQGAAIGLVDAAEDVRAFFDLGAGAYGNVKTRPRPLRFCWRAQPSVILSHWDTDHWAGETSDPVAASAHWLAPRQTKLTPSHHAFAARILAAGGKLLIWGAPAGTIRSFALGGGQTLTLARCTGSTRNGSGIACLVTKSQHGPSWLLTGDAGYHELGMTIPSNLSTIIVPHHGADMGSSSIPPLRPTGYTRLVYTFGPGNTHGRTKVIHPTSAAVTHHDVRGWAHGLWSLATPGRVVAGGDVLATAENPASGIHSAGRHLESTASGWSSPAIVPFGTVPCSGPTSCTTKVVQA